MIDDEAGKLKILPLGGLGEIGLNMMVLAVGDEALIIDTGIMFPDESMPGVDVVIPNVEPLLEQQWNVRGIVLTHGHEDHIGALPYVLKRINAPVYATPLTMGLVEHKLEEFGLIGTTERNVVSTDEAFDIGPFQVEAFAMCHSIADAVGLAIDTPAGLIIHSGDFKIDPAPIDGRLSDLDKIAAIAAKGVIALLSDSTNVEVAGATSSESTVGPELEKIFNEAPGRVFVSTFSSSIHRIQQVLNVAGKLGRRVALVGRSMVSNARIAAERGYLDVPPDVLVDIKDMDGIPDNQVTVVSTGSQGEPMSAMSLMAAERHKYLKLKPADVVVFSSRFIPGNERAINSMINEFCRRGARVLYEKVAPVHVSGHAAQEELRTMLRVVRPRCFIPIHGEFRHLSRHGLMAVEEGVPSERVLIAENGDLIELSRSGAVVTDQLRTGRIYVDGKGVGDVGNDVLRERRVLSEKGLITVVIVIEEGTGRLISGPQIYSRGVTFEEVEPELMEGARICVEERLAELDPQDPSEWEAAKDDVRLAARRYIKRIFGRKPQVQTIVVHV